MAIRWMRRREQAQNQAAIYFTTTCQIAMAAAPRLQSLRKVIDFCKKCAAVRARSPIMIGGFISDLRSSGAVDGIKIRSPNRNRESLPGRSADRFVTLIEGRSGTPHGS